MVRVLFTFFFMACLVPVPPVAAQQTGENGGSWQASQAQVVPVSFEKVFSFSPYPDAHDGVVNFFLQKIAEGTGRLRVYTEYAYSGEVHARLVPHISRKGCDLVLSLQGAGLSGDLLYRDFGLGKVLVPDRISFELMVYRPDGVLALHEVIRQMDIPPEGGILYRQGLPADCSQPGWSVAVIGIDFFYSDAVHDRFLEWLMVLESYYGAGQELERIPELIAGLSYTDPEKIILDEFGLCEAEQVIARARYAPFNEWFGQEENDPAGVFSMLEAFGSQTAMLRQAFNQAISRIDTLFFEKAIATEEEGDSAKGRELFQSALVYNPYHLGANHALARMDHMAGDQSGAISRLGRVIARMYPSGVWKDRIHALTDQVLEAIFESGAELAEDGRFLDALDALADVEEFCHTVTGRLACPARLHQLQSLSHQGMFRSFLIVSERALANDNLSFCVTYLRSAMDYQQEHPAFIPDVRDAASLLQKVVARHIGKGATLWLKGEHTAAWDHFQSAASLCEEFDFLECGRLPSQP
jgi:tetratricopeptide (TPR) repeat protein